MSDIFISYASEDRPKAQTLARFLENERWSIFWDRTIPIGLTWDQFIGKELTEARCVVVLWSQTSINSEWVREEAGEGKKRGILIPIRIEEVEPPFGFRGIQAGDLYNWDEALEDPEFQWVVSNIARVVGKPPRQAEEEQSQRAEEQARHKAQQREQAEEEAKRKAAVAAEAETKRRVEEEATKREQAKREAKREADAAAERKAHAKEAEASAEGMARHKVEVKREERAAAKLGKRTVTWGFPIGSVVLAFGFFSLFGVNGWNWVGAKDVDIGGAATGLLLAFVIALGRARGAACTRAGLPS